MSRKRFHIPERFILFVLMVMVSVWKSYSQDTLSSPKEVLTAPSRTDTTHSPKKATIYSAVLPGLGQYYNKKYWKIPLVYAAIGGCLTAALINNNEYKTAKDELIFRTSNPGLTLNSRFTSYADDQLLARSDYYRKWRDNMFIFTGLAYVLNIIDANVDAHLFNFNVNEDLAVTMRPYTFSPEFQKPLAGMSFTLKFK